MKGDVLERERKYELGTGSGVPRLEGLPGVTEVSTSDRDELDAVYYDTPDLRLARFGGTLRRRQGGPDAGWQLKIPAGPDTRVEVRAPLGDDAEPPRKLTDLVAGVVRDAALVQVARIATDRRRLRLLGDGGAPLAEVTDDWVTGHRAGAGAPRTWRELEVELAEDTDARMLDEVEPLLRKAGLRRSAAGSKLHRVLDLDTPVAARPGRKASAGEAVLTYLRTQVDAIARQDVLVRRGAADAVHQLRVATRRTRSALRVFGAIVDRERTSQIRCDLRWLGRQLGAARDTEVLERRLRSAVADLPDELVLGAVNTRLTRYFGPRQAAADQAVLATLGDPRYYRLRDRLDELLAAPPLTARAGKPARKELPRQVRKIYRKLARRMRTVSASPAGPRRDAAMHQARKAAKRLRYAAEIAAPVTGKPATRVRKRAKAVTTALGEFQDGVVARPVLRQLGVAAHLAGDNGFTFGLLIGQERAGARSTLRDAAAAWDRLSSGKSKAWLTG